MFKFGIVARDLSKKHKKEKSSQFYDSLRKHEWKNSADFGPSTRTRYRIIKRILKKNNIHHAASILDTGCGSGNQMTVLQEAGYTNINGSDFSDEAISLSKKRGFSCTFQANLVHAQDFGSQTYDVVICSEVLEHIEDDERAIDTLFDLLNPDGLLIISVPFLLKHWSKHDEFSGHVRRYEPGELENKISQHFSSVTSFAWGNFLFAIYYYLLKRSEPKQIMSTNKIRIKKYLSKFLYILFFLDDLFISNTKGIRLYLVAKK